MPLVLPPPSVGLGDGDADVIQMGTGTSVPPGVDAVIEFNGLFMNRRDLIDTFVITEIDGLGDADIRDDREVNPEAHGETAFDAFYGGRTVTFSGRIRCFALNKLRDMEQALRAAFADIQNENIMTFHTQSPQTDSMLFCKKSAPLAIKEVQTQLNQFERDFMLTVRASNPRLLSKLNHVDNRSLAVIDLFSFDSIGSGVYTFITGAGTASSTSGTLEMVDTTRKQIFRNDRLLTSDNEVVIKYIPDATFTSSQVAGLLKVLDTNDFLTAGVDATGHLFIKKTILGSESTVYTSSSTVSRSAGVPYWLRVSQNGNVVTIDHATIDPRIDESGITLTTSQVLGSTEAAQLGIGVAGQPGIDIRPGSISWAFDEISMGASRLSSVQTMAPVNVGNFECEPIIVLGGPMNNPVVYNATNGDTLTIDGSISAGDVWTIDIAERAMVDIDGANQFGFLDVGSDWLVLEPGENSLRLSADGLRAGQSGSGVWIVPQMTVYHRHTWL